MVSVDTTGMKKVGDGVGLGGAHHGLSPNMSSVAAAAPVCGAGVGSRVITVKSPLWSPLPARAAEIPAMATAVVMQRRTVAMLGKFSLHWVVVAPIRTPKHDIIEHLQGQSGINEGQRQPLGIDHWAGSTHRRSF